MRNSVEYNILNAVSATGAGNAIFVEDFRHKEIAISVAGMGAGDTITVKIQGSSSEDAPGFDAAKTASNEWDYIQMVDLEDASTIDGDTGITFADSNDLRKFAVNVDGLKWVTANITAITDTTSTSATVTIVLFND